MKIFKIYFIDSKFFYCEYSNQPLMAQVGLVIHFHEQSLRNSRGPCIDK